MRQSKENLQSELADLVQSKTELEVRKANLEVCFRNVSLDLASMRGSRERLEQINEALEADLSGAKTRAFDASKYLFNLVLYSTNQLLELYNLFL